MTSNPRYLWLLLALPILAWGGNTLYAFAPRGSTLEEYAPALVAAPLIAHAIWHGRLRYGGAVLFRFAVIVFAIGWSFETLSVITGVPFGRYHYTEAMAPFLGHVPVFVLPAYALTGYAAWTIAGILTGALGARPTAAASRSVPIVAALVMVVWDLSMDPLRATVEARWIWTDGGPHAGIPLSNYLGWFLVTWLMFQCFALSLRRASAEALPPPPRTPLYWLSAVLAYAAFAVEYLLNPLTGKGAGLVVPVNGAEVAVQDIYVYAAQTTLLTMIPVIALAGSAAFLPLRAGAGGHGATAAEAARPGRRRG